ncbi:MAG: hypothetical protein QXW80_05450 [Candidatus Micrarchaeia archaeon]
MPLCEILSYDIEKVPSRLKDHVPDVNGRGDCRPPIDVDSTFHFPTIGRFF